MRIIIGHETEKAMKVLNIKTYPFTYKELKVNFYNLMKQWHPDIAKCSKEEAEKKTKKIIFSFRLIENLAINEDSISENKVRIIKELEKDDMFNFWEKCEFCFGTGRIRKFMFDTFGRKKETYFISCWKCKGVGKIKSNPFNPVIRKGAVL